MNELTDIEAQRLFRAGRAAGRALPPLRFATEEERDAWREQQKQILIQVLAPVGDEPYDENLQGDKIALCFADIFTFELCKLLGTRCIVGDFATYDEYQDHLAAEWEATIEKEISESMRAAESGSSATNNQ